MSKVAMTERHRALPPWMSKEKEKEPRESRKKRKVAKSFFYCLNEKELVEAAVLYLTERAEGDLRGGQQTAAPETAQASPNPADSSEDSTDCSEVQDTTYVSETDIDISEMETLPYALSTKGSREVESATRAGQDHCDERPNMDMATEAKEDDDFRLVREIFFT